MRPGGETAAINPNTTEAMTRSMAEEARRFASPATEIVAVTAAFGPQYVANRIEVAIAGHAVVDAMARYADGCDAAIVSAFGDPGLAAARDMPIFRWWVSRNPPCSPRGCWGGDIPSCV